MLQFIPIRLAKSSMAAVSTAVGAIVTASAADVIAIAHHGTGADKWLGIGIAIANVAA